MTDKPRIAHFAGPNATIQNSPPLVTSNKARAKYGLPLKTNPDGSAVRFDGLRAQRLAAPVTLYVEQFSAHPLERDAAELYAPPDGYIDAAGNFHKTRTAAGDKPVYEVRLLPEDGVYTLPYMARQADGSAWEDDGAGPLAPAERSRQPYYPDGARIFEEIDRLAIGEHGENNLISARAEIDFYRVLPSSGYTKGLAAGSRTDAGKGDIPPERRGRDFFPYRPRHLNSNEPRLGLARIANGVQRALSSGRYLGAIWTQGSPRIEETIYWLNLLIDSPLPVCGNAAQRTHGQVSEDGSKNLIDSVEYITSRVWADAQGKNRVGAVLVQEQQVFAAREVQKGDARPGGYVVTGGHGGILGAVGNDVPPTLVYLPATRHSYLSEVNITRLPRQTLGVRRADGRLATVEMKIKDAAGDLFDGAIPKVMIVKDGAYHADGFEVEPDREVDLLARIDHNLAEAPLAGFVVEGLSPYGSMNALARQEVMFRAVHSGMPVVCVGRGNNEGFAPPRDRMLGGRNLTATKARLLLLASLMKFGALPPAADPAHPTASELDAIRAKLAQYQAVFDTH